MSETLSSRKCSSPELLNQDLSLFEVTARDGMKQRMIALLEDAPALSPIEDNWRGEETERTPPMPLEDAQVLSLIEDTLRDGETNRMLSLSTKDAQITLDVAWDLLGSSLSQRSHTEGSPPLYGTPVSRSILRRISVKLALKHDILPSSIFLQGIRRWESECRCGGAFADVYYAGYGGVPVALKKIRLFTTTSEEDRQEKMKALYVETLLWKGLSHLNVLPFLGVSDVFKGTICMVLSWRPKTIRQHRSNLRGEGSLSARMVNQWLYQIALGLAYLHEEGVIHGDLHGGNVLVDEEGTPQLTDFGMAVIADAMPYAYHSMHGGGAVRWTAPELLDPELAGLTSRRPTTASDVYSFACLSIELYTGEKPFPTLGDFQAQTRVLRGERPPCPPLPGGKQMGNNMWKLIESCWASDPQARPRCKDIVKKLKTPITTLAPTYEVLKLPTNRENRHVLNVGLSENYVAVLTRFSIEVYSLDDLTRHDTLDAPSGRQFYCFAVVGDTVAVCSTPSTGSQDCAIHIWNLPRHHCGLFAIRARSVRVAAVKQGDTKDSEAHVARPTFLVSYGLFSDRGPLGPHGVGALTPPDGSLTEPVDAVPLMENKYYQSFFCPKEARPLKHIIALGSYVVASCSDSKIRRWTTVDGSCTHVIEMQGEVKNLSIDTFDKGMACAWLDGQLVVWDFNVSPELHTWVLEGPSARSTNAATIHLNHVISRDKSGDVRIWTHNFAESRTLSHGDEHIWVFNCRQCSIITISQTMVKVWNIVTGDELQSFDLKSDCWEGVDKEIWQSTPLSVRSNRRLFAAWGGKKWQKVYLWRFNGET